MFYPKLSNVRATYLISNVYLLSLRLLCDKKAIESHSMKRMVLNSSNLVIFDLETTDKDPTKAEIIELAALCGERTFHRYLDTKNKLSQDLYAFGQIDYAKYEAEKILAEHALQEFLEFIGDAPLCGHNIYEYDLPILTRAFSEAKLTAPLGLKTSAIDTLRWAHLRFPTPPDGLNGYSVGHLFHFITQQDMQGAHLALEDCKATRAVLLQTHLLTRHCLVCGNTLTYPRLGFTRRSRSISKLVSCEKP